MSLHEHRNATKDEESRTSWLPLIIVVMCQIQISFNAFTVSIQGIVDDLGIPASSVGLALSRPRRSGSWPSAIPLAQVVSLPIAGAFASSIGWRWSFVLLSAIGVGNLGAELRAGPDRTRPDVVIDWTGAALSSIGVILDSLQLTLTLLAGLALLALVPAGGMPDFGQPDLTVEDEEGIASGTRST